MVWRRRSEVAAMRNLACVMLCLMVLCSFAACARLYEEANYPEMRFEPGTQ